MYKLRIKLLTYVETMYSPYDNKCTYRQTPTTHIISTTETLYVISIKHRLSLPDDGSYVIRNMLKYILMCLLDFYITYS